MDIFEKIAFAQSMSDDTRKQNLIPMLEDLHSVATGEHIELKLDKKTEMISMVIGNGFKQISVKNDNALGLVRDVIANI